MTYDLELLAKQAMTDKGLEPIYGDLALKQLQTIHEPAAAPDGVPDLRKLLWCSIDNDDSRDLDQLTFAERNPEGKTDIWVAIADVDGLVPKDSPIDMHAQINTTSVYTPACIFPMLPEKLSTNLTSLNEQEDRMAVVTHMTVNDEGHIEKHTIFRALVHNHAQLTYRGVGGWFDGRDAIPEKIALMPRLEQTLRLQHQIAQALKKQRHEMGALTLASSKVEAKVVGDEISVQIPPHNFASQLIEHFMIAANSCMAAYFKQAKIPSLRRVVKIPERWDRIVKIANELDFRLPKQPDSKALDLFLKERRKVDPDTFPDLSLTVIKLLGSGEYIVEHGNEDPTGHFGLALSEYTHSTAPNRRFPDLMTQRQIKAHLIGQPHPYEDEELLLLAEHCTHQEDAAKKVERHMVKSAAAMFLSSRIGSEYNGIVTGASAKGTWVRVIQPPVEGKIVAGFQGLDVGDRVSVKLVAVDVPKGFIDFIIIK